MAGADPEDQPAATEVVEGGVLLGGEQRVAQADDGDVTEQPYPLGGGGEEGEGGDRVVPDRAHRGREPARDGDVVAAGDVVEAGALGAAGDVQEVLGSGGGLPRFGVEGALRLDGELDAVPDHLGPSQSPSGVSPRRSIAFPRTIRSTTSASRCPICASPTSLDFGQVESEWG